MADPVATTLRLEPLPAGEIRRLSQARLGVERPARSARSAGDGKGRGQRAVRRGNPELPDRAWRAARRRRKSGIRRRRGSGALPASVQSLLTARVDRLAPQDRALLQAAAVIGRRFDPQLLAAVAELRRRRRGPARRDAGARSRPSRGQVAGDYAFKHALVRDALYQSLLTGPRAALHLEDRRRDRTPQRQSPPRGSRDARPSLRRDGPRRQSVHLSRAGRREEPWCLFSRRGDDPSNRRSRSARQKSSIRLRRSGRRISRPLHASVEL